ncbi:MAG: hypothetical protein DRN81_04095 [Thermoproteota archaeon]|nr:MAG: hypothetical protein DRN81_04095 [Candidatus Korarchaeota archaeon]
MQAYRLIIPLLLAIVTLSLLPTMQIIHVHARAKLLDVEVTKDTSGVWNGSIWTIEVECEAPEVLQQISAETVVDYLVPFPEVLSVNSGSFELEATEYRRIKWTATAWGTQPEILNATETPNGWHIKVKYSWITPEWYVTFYNLEGTTEAQILLRLAWFSDYAVGDYIILKGHSLQHYQVTNTNDIPEGSNFHTKNNYYNKDYFVEAGEGAYNPSAVVYNHNYNNTFWISLTNGSCWGFEYQSGNWTGVAEWDVQEGCGDGYIDADNTFTMSVIQINGYTVSTGEVNLFNSTIAFDSYGHCYATGISIYEHTLQKAIENYTVSELVSELNGYKKQFTVVVGSFPQLAEQGAQGVYVGQGWAIVSSFDNYIVCHEFAHACGKCDPTPYEDLKVYWRDKYGGGSYSVFSNATWYFETSDRSIKLWITLLSRPVLSCGQAGTVKLGFKANKELTLSATASCANCSVIPETTSFTVTTVQTTHSWTVTPPSCSQYGITTFSLHLQDQSGELDRYLSFPLLILGQDVGGWNITNPYGNSTFWQQLINLSSQLWQNDYTNADAIRNAQRAQEDIEAAERCYYKARNTTDPEKANLYMQAADMWLIAAQYRLQAAAAYEKAPAGWIYTYMEAHQAEENAIAAESKAKSLERAADYFGGSTFLPGFWSLLEPIFEDYSNWLNTIGMILTLIGIALTVIGLLIAATSKGSRRFDTLKLGIILLIIGAVIWALF